MTEKSKNHENKTDKQNSGRPNEINQVQINSDADISGNVLLKEPVEESDEIERLKTDLQDSKDKFLRQAAEFDNYRKRNAKERVELMQTAAKDVISSLLDVLDDSDRAQQQMEATNNIEQLREGIQIIFNKLRNTLQAKGLKPMESVGKDFNPDLHEAISEIPAPTPEQKGKVLDELQKGYYLNNKIIRFAKVVVGK